MADARWPGPTDLCPIHEALAPAADHGIITLRPNENGADGGYGV